MESRKKSNLPREYLSTTKDQLISTTKTLNDNLHQPFPSSEIFVAGVNLHESLGNASDSTTPNTVLLVPEECRMLELQNLTYSPADDPRNILSKDTEMMLDDVVHSLLLHVFFLISAPTNVLNMLVFYKQGLRERINLCLFLQSFVDLLYMLVNFLNFADRPYLQIAGLYRHQALLKFFLANYLTGLFGLSWASGFTTMVIACERCFCVLSPLHAQRLFQTSTTLVVIVIADLIIVGGFFFVGTTWFLECVVERETGRRWLALVSSPFYLQHKRAVDAVYGYVYGVALPFTFFAVSILATLLTVYKLKKLSSWRETTTSAFSAMSVRDVSVTRMLIGCSVFFIACNTLGVVFRLCIISLPSLSLTGYNRNLFSFMVTLSKLCHYINYSFHFFIYYSMGTRYRRTLKSVICCYATNLAHTNKTTLTKSKETNSVSNRC